MVSKADRGGCLLTARSADVHTIRGDSNPRVHKFCCAVHFGSSQLGEALWFVDIVDVPR